MVFKDILTDEEEINLNSYCWNTCNTCEMTSNTIETEEQIAGELLRIYDVDGRISAELPNKILFYLYSNGQVKKRFILK